MDRDEILRHVNDTVNEILIEPATLTRQTVARTVAGWDSLTHISIVMSVEARFAVRFLVGEVEGTKNVGEFVDLIGTKLARRG